VWKDKKPLAKLFKTESNFYIYDAGTNKIMRCEPAIFALLERLLSREIQEAVTDFLSTHQWDEFIYASRSLRSVIKSQNVLLTTKVKKFGPFDTFEEYAAFIHSSLEILCLETTEICNLRCEYCVYSDHIPFKRSHGKRSMDWEVAQRSIDYLKEHSFNSKKIAISFYGGEPLANFPLIRKAVSYALSIFDKKSLSFSISTNGTLLTPKIAQFLYNNDFKVIVSIDGPKEIHDSYRKDIEEKGTFKRAIQGLRFLIDVYGESSKDKIHLNMVYTPPWSSQKLDRMTQLWDEISWLPRKTRLHITYPTPGTIISKKFYGIPGKENKNLQEWSFDKFFEKYLSKNDSNPIADGVMERHMSEFMKRPVYQEPLERYSLNGCCVPGVRKLFVTVDGTFRLCERINSDAPSIGDVYSGLDIGVIKKIYLDAYIKAITPFCSVCWAVGLCTSCYIDIFNKGQIDVNSRSNHCIVEKQSLERLLSYYCLLMEQDSQKLKYLYDYELL